MKRKILAVLLVLAMICAVAGCGSNSGTSDSDTVSDNTTGQNTETTDDITSSSDSTTGDESSDQTKATLELPQIGVSFWDYLCGDAHANDTPVCIVVGIDQSGYIREATYESPEDIEYAIKQLKKVIISKEVDEDYTDNYNYLAIDWSDGGYTSVSLNLTNLEVFKDSKPHHYMLDNFDDFWKNSKNIAVEAEY